LPNLKDATNGAVEAELERYFEEYDENREVPQQFKAVDLEEQKSMVEFYSDLEFTDPNDFVEKMEDWAGCKGAIIDGQLGYWSTYNPDSKWDWYEVGGRWAEQLIKNKTGQMVDVCSKADLDLNHDFTTFAVVTPDGQWHERGKMGWWAVVVDENETEDEWDKNFRERFIDSQDEATTFVLVDCHI
jgi:hypothetical protein